MGAISGLVGASGGANGTGFAAPQAANITDPTTGAQINQAYTGTQGAMAGQQGLLQALQGQNGLQNQSQVYGQLQGIASGAVNPAQAQFNQNTQANVANQAALMAGQRGAGANVGLMARQAAQQGAATQQQAVGQEASQQAQNQIAAIGQAGNLATTQAGQQIGQTNANVSAQQAEQANLLNAQQGYNTNQVAMQSNINNANAGLAGSVMGGQQALIGGALNGAGAVMGGFGKPAAARGGEIVKLADGTGDVQPAASPTPAPAAPPSGAQSKFGQFLKGAVSGGKTVDSQSAAPTTGPAALQSGMSNLVSALGKPGKQQVATGQDQETSKQDTQASQPVTNPVGGQATSADAQGITSTFAGGGMTHDYRSGGKVNAKSPKEKAVKQGNDYANDKIPAVLSEHEIVLPRSVTLSKDPVAASAKFVQAVIAKRKGRK